MVRPPEAEINSLKQVVRDIREALDENGFSVGVAVGQHQAFTNGRAPASALERAMVVDAARRSASQAGLWPVSVSGGGLDIVSTSDITIRRYRLKSVRLTAEGGIEIICGKGSTLLTSEPDSAFSEERWVLGYVMSDDHTIERFIAAEVVDWSGEGPCYLVLGTVIDLSDYQPPRGFTSTDEGLPGFDDEDGEVGDVSGF